MGGSRSRIRAIQILFSVASVDLIEEISGASIKGIRQGCFGIGLCVIRKSCASNVDRDYLQLALFVAELESLRMTTSLGAFQSCNKEGLIRTLWKNRSQEPRVCVRLSWCSS